MSRPDVAKAASELSKYLMNPTREHLSAANHCIAYLNGTRFLAIEYDGMLDSDIFLCASDAAYADNADRKSSEGYLCTLYGGPIDWRAAKQKTVTTSTAEAEFLAISQAAKQLYWWKRLFEAITFDPDHEMSILCDNAQTVRLLTNEDPIMSTKLRHVDIYQHWLRQEVQRQKIVIHWIPTAKMSADGLTKMLPRQKHENFVKMLHLEVVKSMTAGGV